MRLRVTIVLDSKATTEKSKYSSIIWSTILSIERLNGQPSWEPKTTCKLKVSLPLHLLYSEKSLVIMLLITANYRNANFSYEDESCSNYFRFTLTFLMPDSPFNSFPSFPSFPKWIRDETILLLDLQDRFPENRYVIVFHIDHNTKD